MHRSLTTSHYLDVCHPLAENDPAQDCNEEWFEVYEGDESRDVQIGDGEIGEAEITRVFKRSQPQPAGGRADNFGEGFGVDDNKVRQTDEESEELGQPSGQRQRRRLCAIDM